MWLTWSELLLLPLWWQMCIAAGFGVIIGSFLNVYLYRFHTGRSLAGDSHCLSCGTSLRWYELFPVLSYLALRGRCRSCGSYIPVRYALVEGLAGILFILGWLQATSFLELVWWWALVSVLLLIVVYDLYHYIIPDAFTIAVAVLAGLQLIYQYWWVDTPMIELGYTALAATLGAGFFYGLWWYSGGQWLGFGDVKLILPLGLIVGPVGVFSMIVASFWIGAIVSLAIIGLQAWLRRGQPVLRSGSKGLTMKSAVPFAPFLVAGALLVLFTSFNALTFF